MEVERFEISGWEALRLTGALIQATVLPGKGADIVSVRELRSGLDPLLKTPWGLRPPGAVPAPGSDGVEFVANYEGGWQTLFPSVNGPAEFSGAQLPFHGEVALVPWRAVEIDNGSAVCLSVLSQLLPLRFERILRFEEHAPTLRVTDTIANLGQIRVPFVLGEHCMFGPPFIGSGARLDLPGGRIVTLPIPAEHAARLAAGQSESWPHGRLAVGSKIDLREVPGPETGSTDDIYLVDVPEGWATISGRGGRVRLEWDAEVFRCVVLWMAYGGAHTPPLSDIYGLGVEPWTSRFSLPEAVAADQARWLNPGEQFETTVSLTVEGDDPFTPGHPWRMV